MVYCLYPETNQRSLEEIDLLFAAETPWVWDAERTFLKLKEEGNLKEVEAGMGGGVRRGKEGEVDLLEEGGKKAFA